jgi:hypothetical protein
MVAVPLAAVLAALTFAVCMAVDLTPVVGVVCAVLVLAASLPTIGERFGPRGF